MLSRPSLSHFPSVFFKRHPFGSPGKCVLYFAQSNKNIAPVESLQLHAHTTHAHKLGIFVSPCHSHIGERAYVTPNLLPFSRYSPEPSFSQNMKPYRWAAFSWCLNNCWYATHQQMNKKPTADGNSDRSKKQLRMMMLLRIKKTLPMGNTDNCHFTELQYQSKIKSESQFDKENDNVACQ